MRERRRHNVVSAERQRLSSRELSADAYACCNLPGPRLGKTGAGNVMQRPWCRRQIYDAGAELRHVTDQEDASTESVSWISATRSRFSVGACLGRRLKRRWRRCSHARPSWAIPAKTPTCSAPTLMVATGGLSGVVSSLRRTPVIHRKAAAHPSIAGCSSLSAAAPTSCYSR